MDYAATLTLALPYDQVLAATREALAAEGFGIPAEIDTQAVFKAKLGFDSERRVILGACMPKVAYEALQADPALATLLPCNVVVREVPGGSEVAAIRPTAYLALSDRFPEAEARKVEDALLRALDRLRRAVQA